MSIDVMTWVFRNSEATLADRLVLLAMADYAHDDGGGCYPSIAKMAAKARVSPRTVERSILNLIKQGEIEETPRTPKGSRSWRILMGRPARQIVERAEGDRQDVEAAPTSAPSETDKCAIAPYREPLVEPSEEPSTADSQEQLAHPPGNGELWIDDVIKEVFAAWHSGTGMNGNSKLTPERKKKIRLRLEEASADGGLAAGRREVLDAVGFVVHSDWHRANGHQDFTLIFRSRDSIEKYAKLERQKRDSLPPPPDPRFAGYDTTTPNPELEGGTDAA